MGQHRSLHLILSSISFQYYKMPMTFGELWCGILLKIKMLRTFVGARMVSNFYFHCSSCAMLVLQDIGVFQMWDKNSSGTQKKIVFVLTI
jgi:hypothetical protein